MVGSIVPRKLNIESLQFVGKRHKLASKFQHFQYERIVCHGHVEWSVPTSAFLAIDVIFSAALGVPNYVPSGKILKWPSL